MYRIGYILYFSIYCKVPKLFSRLYDFLSTFFIDVVKFRLEYISIHSSVFSCVHKVYTFFSWLGVLERFTTSKLPLFRFFFKRFVPFYGKFSITFFSFCFIRTCVPKIALTAMETTLVRKSGWNIFAWSIRDRCSLLRNHSTHFAILLPYLVYQFGHICHIRMAIHCRSKLTITPISP